MSQHLALRTLPPGRDPWRSAILTLVTRLLRPKSVLAARRWIRAPGPHRLNLGCGPRPLDGWLNIDFTSRARVDLALDLRRRLPFPDSSVDAIFSEHALDYLDYPEAERLVRECVRVLRSGGVARFGLPDFRRYADSYVRGTDFLEARRPGASTPLLALAEIPFGYGHRSVWDAETLVYLLSACGLEAEERAHGDSRLEPHPDDERPERVAETVYVEGVKP